MSVLFIAAIIGGYIFYTVWYSIANGYYTSAILILSVCAVISMIVWVEGVMLFVN